MAVKPIPDGYHSVTPYLIVDDAARALEYYTQAFGAKELFRMGRPDGKIAHCEFEIGNSRVMMADEAKPMNALSPTTVGGSPVHLMIYLDDVDAVFKRAIAAGGTETQPVRDQFYGDRSGSLSDPFGHMWTVATHKEDVPAEEMEQRMKAMAQTT